MKRKQADGTIVDIPDPRDSSPVTGGGRWLRRPDVRERFLGHRARGLSYAAIGELEGCSNYTAHSVVNLDSYARKRPGIYGVAQDGDDA